MRFSYSLLITILWIIFSAGTCLSPNNRTNDYSSTGEYASCMPMSDTKDDLEIVTFNMENFPKNGDATIEAVAMLFNAINADVYALQEVKSQEKLKELVNRLNGYSCIYYPKTKSDLALAFIYKESEVSVYNNETEVLFSNSYYFPRPAFKIKIHHKSLNKDIYLINNHLKCCNDGDSKERREEASNMLKDYIDTFLDDEAVIVLGDFNDKITGNGGQTFSNFIDDPSNYTFTDMTIAQGPRSGWSYPSYPSHIDHILVTNELFENIDAVSVFNMSSCIVNFSKVISDHRPLGIIFKKR